MNFFKSTPHSPAKKQSKQTKTTTTTKILLNFNFRFSCSTCAVVRQLSNRICKGSCHSKKI